MLFHSRVNLFTPRVYLQSTNFQFKHNGNCLELDLACSGCGVVIQQNNLFIHTQLLWDLSVLRNVHNLKHHSSLLLQDNVNPGLSWVC